MKWGKGVSGNLKGRPKKGQSLSDMLGEALTTEKRQELARVLIDLALAGDLAAIKLILDRVDGLATSRLEVSGEMKTAAVFMAPDQMMDADAWGAMVAKLEADEAG